MTDNRKDIAKKTLEDQFYKDVVTTNYLKLNPSRLGDEGYNAGNSLYPEVLSSNEAVDIKKEIQEYYNHLGVAGSPGDAEVSRKVIESVDQALMTLSFGGELEGVVGADLVTPEPLKGKAYADFQEIMMKGDKMDDKEKKLVSTAQQYFSLVKDYYTMNSCFELTWKDYKNSVKKKSKVLAKPYDPKK